MIAQVEHCYRITVPCGEPEEAAGISCYSSDYCSCSVDRISAYDRCVLFTLSFFDGAGRDFIIGKTDEGNIWYLDLQDYAVGEVSADCDIEDVTEEIACSDACYGEEEVLLISAAIVQMIKDYAYSLRSPATYAFRPLSNSDLPF